MVECQLVQQLGQTKTTQKRALDNLKSAIHLCNQSIVLTSIQWFKYSANHWPRNLSTQHTNANPIQIRRPSLLRRQPMLSAKHQRRVLPTAPARTTRRLQPIPIQADVQCVHLQLRCLRSNRLSQRTVIHLIRSRQPERHIRLKVLLIQTVTVRDANDLTLANITIVGRHSRLILQSNWAEYQISGVASDSEDQSVEELTRIRTDSAGR